MGYATLPALAAVAAWVGAADTRAVRSRPRRAAGGPASPSWRWGSPSRCCAPRLHPAPSARAPRWSTSKRRGGTLVGRRRPAARGAGGGEFRTEPAAGPGCHPVVSPLPRLASTCRRRRWRSRRSSRWPRPPDPADAPFGAGRPAGAALAAGRVRSCGARRWPASRLSPPPARRGVRGTQLAIANAADRRRGDRARARRHGAVTAWVADASRGLPAAGRPLQEARGPAAVPVNQGDQTVVAREPHALGGRGLRRAPTSGRRAARRRRRAPTRRGAPPPRGARR